MERYKHPERHAHWKEISIDSGSLRSTVSIALTPDREQEPIDVAVVEKMAEKEAEIKLHYGIAARETAGQAFKHMEEHVQKVDKYCTRNFPRR